jgi:acetyl-CoA acyltransferase
MLAYDVGRLAVKGLLDKTALDPKSIDYVTFGTVIQEVRTSNLAREVSLGAGIPNDVPSHTVTQACISANQAICTGAEKILAGRADIVVAGGAEIFSDVPIRFSRKMRKNMLAADKVKRKGMGAMVNRVLKGLSLKDLAPETPAIANFATGEVMGHNSDRLASRFGVTRQQQDDFALASHTNAQKAHDEGFYDEEVIPVNGSTVENGIFGNFKNGEDLAKFRPAFVRPHGTHTGGNASFLTDGAAACLIMSDEKAAELGYTPKTYIREWTFQAVDPFEELLLGPAYSCAKVLKDAGLTLADMDVIELHEAFAGQVLANIAAMGSDEFGREKLGLDGKLGDVDMSKLNLAGGSLAVGHPFGATGARLVTTASNRLIKEGGRYALIAACADSGLGHACILERYGAK